MNTSQFFDPYFNNAEVNSIMILDIDGNILDINRAFTNNFGYTIDDLKGKNFSMLFTEKDNKEGKPQLEIHQVRQKGQAHAANYIVDNMGNQVWCTGEALLVSNEEGKKYIVKDIINLQAKKQLQLFLMETEDLLERIFESAKEIPIMILDGSLKVQKVNEPFLRFFQIKEQHLIGSSLSKIPHPFWHNEDVKKEVSQMIVTNQPIKEKEFLFQDKSGVKAIKLNAKIIEKHQGNGRKIFIIIEEYHQMIDK